MRILVWLLAAVPLACGKDHRLGFAGDGSEDDQSDSTVTAETFSAHLAQAHDEQNQRCCKQAGLHYASSVGLGDGLPGESVIAEFDAHAAATCLRDTRNAPCPRAKEEFSSPKSCSQVFKRGSVKLGAICTSNWDCAPSAEPNVFPYCNTTCKFWYMLSEGADCSARENATLDCGFSLLCNEDNVCVRRAQLGESCLTGSNWGDTCAPGLVCDRNGTKRCVKPTPVGKPCTEPEDCEWLACIGGLCRDPLFVVTVCEPE